MVLGLTNPPIGEALAFDATGDVGDTFGVVPAECRAAIIAEVKLGNVAVQMGLTAMLIDTLHAALEDREHVLDGVGMDREAVLVADILASGMLDGAMRGKLLACLGVEAAFVGYR